MADIASRTTTAEPTGFSFRLPRPLWMGLTAVILLIAAVGLNFGLPIYRQHAAVQEAQLFGGGIEIRPSRPTWVSQMTPKKYRNLFDDVVVVKLNDTRYGDRGAARLAGLRNLRELWLGNTAITDTALDQVGRLADLKWLSLRDTQVTDAGVIQLQRLTKLEWLSLSGTKVTDAGLKHLTGMNNLRFLALNGTAVSDRGVAELKRALPELSCERRSSITSH